MRDVFGVEALFEVLDVQADGARVQAQADGDLFGGAAFGEQAEHLALPLRQGGQTEQAGGSGAGGAALYELEGDGMAAVGTEEIEDWRLMIVDWGHGGFLIAD